MFTAHGARPAFLMHGQEAPCGMRSPLHPATGALEDVTRHLGIDCGGAVCDAWPSVAGKAMISISRTAGHLPNYSTSAAPRIGMRTFHPQSPIGLSAKGRSSRVLTRKSNRGDIAVLLTDGLTQAANGTRKSKGWKSKTTGANSIQGVVMVLLRNAVGEARKFGKHWMIRVCYG